MPGHLRESVVIPSSSENERVKSILRNNGKMGGMGGIRGIGRTTMNFEYFRNRTYF